MCAKPYHCIIAATTNVHASRLDTDEPRKVNCVTILCSLAMLFAERTRNCSASAPDPFLTARNVENVEQDHQNKLSHVSLLQFFTSSDPNSTLPCLPITIHF